MMILVVVLTVAGAYYSESAWKYVQKRVVCKHRISTCLRITKRESRWSVCIILTILVYHFCFYQVMQFCKLEHHVQLV